MATFNRHIVREGDRWDTIAYQWYGNAGLFSHLIEDNQHLSIWGELVAGETVFIRTDIENNTQINQYLPPWQR
jgi:phage tail protein X